MTLKFTEETELAFFGLVNLGDDDNYLGLTLTRKFTDTLQFKVGADVITGASGTFLGRWHDDDRVLVTLYSVLVSP